MFPFEQDLADADLSTRLPETQGKSRQEVRVTRRLLVGRREEEVQRICDLQSPRKSCTVPGDRLESFRLLANAGISVRPGYLSS